MFSRQFAQRVNVGRYSGANRFAREKVRDGLVSAIVRSEKELPRNQAFCENIVEAAVFQKMQRKFIEMPAQRFCQRSRVLVLIFYGALIRQRARQRYAASVTY